MQNSNYSFITPSSTLLSEELLFFDTFSHSGSDKDNFDLVQFPSPVIIDLIKIVPLGQPVEAKIPGNVRLGATNPSKCELEFFINDLSKQDAHTMTDLGKFHCSEKETDFNPPLQIQTDGLLLRGSYRTLTLAIFGQISAFEDKLEDEVLKSAASPPAQTPASPVASERDNPYILRQPIKLERDESELYEESTQPSEDLLKSEGSSTSNNSNNNNNNNVNNIINNNTADIAEPEPEGRVEIIKEDPCLSMVEELSGSEIGATTVHYPIPDKRLDDTEYSNSTELDHYAKRLLRGESTSRYLPSTDKSVENEQSEKSYTDDLEISEWTFDLATYRPKPLIYFADPSLTLQERSILATKLKLAEMDCKDIDEREIEKVRETFDVLGCTDDLKTDDWVTLIEDLANDLANMSLAQTISNEAMIKFLVTLACQGLDINLALRQRQTGFRVRHLRAGLKLTTVMFHCGDPAIQALLEANIPQKVIELYYGEQMSLPLRLLICKCLNAITDSVKGVEYITTHQCNWNTSNLSMSHSRKVIQSKYNQSTASPSRDSKDGVRDEQEVESMTCYQALILILLSQPTTRVTIAIGNLIRKMKLFDSLSKLRPSYCDEQEESEDSVFDSVKDTLLRTNGIEKNLSLLQDIVNLTKDGCMNIAQPTRSLPAKIQFQVKPIPGDIFLAIFKWLKHFRTLEFIDSLLGIKCNDSMSISEIQQVNKLQGLCLAFIQKLAIFPRAMQFLLSSDCCEVTCNIIRTLADKQHPKKPPHLRLSDTIGNCVSTPDCPDEFLTVSSCHDLSLRLAYNFKVFSCIDKLFHFHREMIGKRDDTSVCDPEKILHQLYIISEHPYGLSAIVKHFSHIGNLDCLLRFLDMPETHKQLEFVKETSIDYVLELVGTFLRLNNSVLEIADEYLDTLSELCKNKDKNLSIRIKSLLPWLNPFDPDQPQPLITYTEETFKQLTRVIRKSIPNCSIPFAKELDFELPPQMITAVRILRQLCISPQVESYIEANFDMFSMQKLTTHITRPAHLISFVDSLPLQQSRSQLACEDSMSDQLNQISNTFKLSQPYEEDICGDLKYHYGIIHVFEQEGLRRLLNTLRELTGNYPKPIYQSAALSGLRGRIVISYIHSVVMLLHSIICHLIDARGSEFRDTSVIPVILETYSLLCFVPPPREHKQPKQTGDINTLNRTITLRSDNHLMAQQTKKLILSILMAYTQMCLSVSESEEKVISKSMWTKMLKEVMDFTLSTPVFFHHGLDVLTKILPSPLPSSSIMDSIDQEQLFKNINHRKLWSAHLHPLHQQIEQMISNLCICYKSNIRALLYYLCNQLCDLSPNAACMVAKIITDTLIMYASKLHQDTIVHNNGTSPAEHGAQLLLQAASGSAAAASSSSTNIQTNTQSTSGDVLDSGAPPGPANLAVSKESAYAVKMILSLLSNLITNQAFETAFSNYLQMLGKKDEKLLNNLRETLIFYEEYNPGEQLDDAGANQNTSGVTSVSLLIKSIKAVNNEHAKSDGYTNSVIEPTPPEDLTKINLVDLSRKISDRSFALHAGLTKTYRLKVLMDLNARAQRSTEMASSSSKRFDRAPYPNYQEISVPSSHKSYVAPLRGRGRSAARPDPFRSRPQNTSRPPSIHVDDFVDPYSDSSMSGQSSAARYPVGPIGAGSGGGSASSKASLPLPPPLPADFHPPGNSSNSGLAPGSHRASLAAYYGSSGPLSSGGRSSSPAPYRSRSHSRSKHLK